MTECPGEQSLLDFLSGRLEPSTQAAIAEHVETCAACQERLEALTAHPSLLLPNVTGAEVTTAEHTSEVAGTLLADRYRLREVIGEGGMGTVWSADQLAPVRRSVAVKVIKAGLDGRAVLHRFEAERQALALMDHPNVAKVLDGGETTDGRPYFVMELVAGHPLTNFCDDARLDVRGRLELFAAVCRAVQHAHQKGIVHRDLKPSNILVTEQDGRPVPKVIDFGVAKAVGGRLTDSSLTTHFGTVVGTLEYMSPEQAGYAATDVDTRADVYSLGVILYELLTGLRPIDAERLRKAALAEMLRLLHEEEPSKPSTRVSGADSLPSVAALRQTEPRRLVTLLRGDLDWVVMKCLEKSRDRRYESASALARDVDQYLADEPVEARPPSAAYRVRKFLRRHRLPVAAAGLVLAALVAAVVGTSWGLVAANRAAAAERDAKLDADARRRDAENATTRAEAGEKLAGERLVEVEAQKRQAEDEKRVAEAVQRFLTNDLLVQADAWKQADALRQLGGNFTAAANPTIRELLDRAAAAVTPEKIEAKFPDQPLVQASILFTIGQTYGAIAEYQKASDHLRRATDIYRRMVGPSDRRTAAAIQSDAMAAKDAGQYPRAADLLTTLIATLQSRMSADDPDVLYLRADLGKVLWLAGRSDEAARMLEDVVAAQTRQLGPTDPATLRSMESLALVYQHAKKAAEALRLFEAVRDARIRDLGPDDPRTMVTNQNIGLTLMENGKPNEAIPLLGAVRDAEIVRFGPDHPATLTVISNLAKAHLFANHVAEAQPLLELVYADRLKRQGPDHPNTLIAGNDLASAYRMTGRYNEAIDLFTKVRAAQIAKLGLNHQNTIVTCTNLAQAYTLAGRPADAIPILEELRDGPLLTFRSDNAQLTGVLNRLAEAYQATGRSAEAIAMLEAARRRIVGELGPDHRQSLSITRNLAVLCDTARDWTQAEPLFRDLFERFTRQSGPTDVATLTNALDLAHCLLQQEKWSEAEPLLREAVALREKSYPDSFTTMQARSMLGEALSRQRKYADAEPLLLGGYQGLRQREADPAQTRGRLLAEAVNRLVRHYEDRSDGERAAEWKREAEKLSGK